MVYMECYSYDWHLYMEGYLMIETLIRHHNYTNQSA
jgi:hypothetical protein